MSTHPDRVCRYCSGPAAPWRQHTASGVRVVIYCSRCDRPSRGKLSYREPPQYTEAELRRMPERGPETRPICFVCHKPGPLETHHLAPRNVFRAEADEWPTVEVCRECHERWHRLMDGAIDRWRRNQAWVAAKRRREMGFE